MAETTQKQQENPQKTQKQPKKPVDVSDIMGILRRVMGEAEAQRNNYVNLPYTRKDEEKEVNIPSIYLNEMKDLNKLEDLPLVMGRNGGQGRGNGEQKVEDDAQRKEREKQEQEQDYEKAVKGGRLTNRPKEAQDETPNAPPNPPQGPQQTPQGPPAPPDTPYGPPLPPKKPGQNPPPQNPAQPSALPPVLYPQYPKSKADVGKLTEAYGGTFPSPPDSPTFNAPVTETASAQEPFVSNPSFYANIIKEAAARVEPQSNGGVFNVSIPYADTAGIGDRDSLMQYYQDVALPQFVADFTAMWRRNGGNIEDPEFQNTLQRAVGEMRDRLFQKWEVDRLRRDILAAQSGNGQLTKEQFQQAVMLGLIDENGQLRPGANLTTQGSSSTTLDADNMAFAPYLQYAVQARPYSGDVYQKIGESQARALGAVPAGRDEYQSQLQAIGGPLLVGINVAHKPLPLTMPKVSRTTQGSMSMSAPTPAIMPDGQPRRGGGGGGGTRTTTVQTTDGSVYLSTQDPGQSATVSFIPNNPSAGNGNLTLLANAGHYNSALQQPVQGLLNTLLPLLGLKGNELGPVYQNGAVANLSKRAAGILGDTGQFARRLNQIDVAALAKYVQENMAPYLSTLDSSATSDRHAAHALAQEVAQMVQPGKDGKKQADPTQGDVLKKALLAFHAYMRGGDDAVRQVIGDAYTSPSTKTTYSPAQMAMMGAVLVRNLPMTMLGRMAPHFFKTLKPSLAKDTKEARELVSKWLSQNKNELSTIMRSTGTRNMNANDVIRYIQGVSEIDSIMGYPLSVLYGTLASSALQWGKWEPPRQQSRSGVGGRIPSP